MSNKYSNALDLENCKFSFPSFQSALCDDDKTILLNVSIPFGAKASVVVPNTFHITERGNSLDSAKGVRGVVQEAQNLNISIGSGSYRFLMSIKAD